MVWRLSALLAALLLLLTYLLVRSTGLDSGQHERTAEALHRITVADAALHRDALKARAGLLPNYDPLVQATSALRDALSALAVAGHSDAEMGARLGDLIREAESQEQLVEAFKSDNAVLQNSMAYFTHRIQRLGETGALHESELAVRTGAVATAMLRFMREPQRDAADEAAAALQQLSGPSGIVAPDSEIRPILAHGRIILRMLPEVDNALALLLGGRTAALAQAFQDAYLDRHARWESRAGIARLLLYVTSVALLAWLAYLWLLLWRKARVLRHRLAFESIVVDISAHFVDLPAGRTASGIERALSLLGGHLAADRAYVLVFGRDLPVPGVSYAWSRRDDDALGREAPWKMLEAIEPNAGAGRFHVPRVAKLPSGRGRSALEERGVRSLLGLPIVHAGRRTGLLVLENVREEKCWSEDDVALLRTVCDVFASALERQWAEAERTALEFRLRHSQRMEAIGTLAGGIAHNFNNILGAILGYGDMALMTLPRHARPREHVEQVMAAGRRAKQVVDQILTFGRRGAQALRPVRAQPIVDEAVRLLRASLPATIRIRARLDACDTVIRSDSSQLQQVVMNLSTNAAQAMDGRGVVELELQTVEVPQRRHLSHGSLAPGRYLRLAVRDTGKGMDAATRERIFEPFFTTRTGDGGTGLGLASVHGIVADHGGALNVRSSPGRGSVFEAYFAASDAPPAEDEERGETPILRGRGETVLLVDDEPSLVLLGEEMLAALGYEPVGFDSSLAALAAIRADPHRFDLMLSDELMPDMTGTQLALAMHALRPEIPILLMTAQDGAIDARQLRAASVREVLHKPILARDLAQSIARQLPR